MEITIFYKTPASVLPDKPKSESLEDTLLFEKMQYSFVTYELKNNKVYFKREKISSNFKNNNDVLTTHFKTLNLCDNISSIYFENDKHYTTDDFEKHIQIVEELNKKIKLNKLR
jgi:hypothetical protein